MASETDMNATLKDLGALDVLGPYDSSKDLYEAAKGFALQHGYVITSAGNSDKDRIRLKCDRGGTYRNRMGPARSNNLDASESASDGQGLRPNTSSWMIDCPFRINGKRQKEGWFMNLTSRYHNHDATEDLSGHSLARVLTEDQRATVTTLAATSIARKKIMSVLLQQNPDYLYLCL
jgi:hypothetical protein